MKLKRTAAVILVFVLLVGCAAWAEDVIGVIMNAKTTQAFTEEAIPEEDVKAILQAGLNATSAINQQPWYFAVVTNKEVMEEISGGSGFGGMTGGMPGSAPGAIPEGMPEGEFPGEMPEGMGENPFGGIPEGGAPAGFGANPGSSSSAKAAMGDSPVAIVIYMNEKTSSPNASFDCGLACQNMVIAANALGYGTKIISSPTMTLNGANHDAMCEKLGVDTSYTAVAVLLIGNPDNAVDGVTGATQRSMMDEKVSFVK